MFRYNGNSFLIKDCVEIANKLVHDNESFHEKIQNSYFDMATCEGNEIDSDIMSNSTIINKRSPFSIIKSIYNLDNKSVNLEESEETIYPLIVETYKSKNPWSSAYGYFSPAKPDHIFLNARKLNRSKGSIVSTLIHEMIHYCDAKNKKESYGHGDNNPKGKENTAPYWIDNLAESIVDNKLEDFNNVENKNIVYRSRWWWLNPLNWFK